MSGALELEVAQTAIAWLGTFVLHSSVLVLGAWFLTRWRGLPVELQEWIWRCAAFGGVLTASLALLLPHAGTAAPRLEWTMGGVASAPAQPLHGEHLGANRTDVQRAHLVELPARSAAIQGERPAVGSGAPGALEHAVAGASPFAAHRTTTTPVEVRWDRAGAWLLLGAWGVLAALLLVRFQRQRRRAIEGFAPRDPCADRSTRALLSNLLERVGRPRRLVRLTESARLFGPVSLRGEICLPASVVREFSADDRECILAHELAHVLRRDPSWRCWLGVVERLFFFQPLLRVARVRLQETAEVLCDDWAARRTGRGLALARCLAEISSWMSTRPSPAHLSGMAASGSLLVRRVERLLESRDRRSSRHVWWSVPMSMMLLGMVMMFAPQVRAVDAPDGAEEAVTVVAVDAQESAECADATKEAAEVAAVFATRARLPADEWLRFASGGDGMAATAAQEARDERDARIDETRATYLRWYEQLQRDRDAITDELRAWQDGRARADHRAKALGEAIDRFLAQERARAEFLRDRLDEAEDETADQRARWFRSGEAVRAWRAFEDESAERDWQARHDRAQAQQRAFEENFAQSAVDEWMRHGSNARACDPEEEGTAWGVGFEAADEFCEARDAELAQEYHAAFGQFQDAAVRKARFDDSFAELSDELAERRAAYDQWQRAFEAQARAWDGFADEAGERAARDETSAARAWLGRVRAFDEAGSASEGEGEVDPSLRRELRELRDRLDALEERCRCGAAGGDVTHGHERHQDRDELARIYGELVDGFTGQAEVRRHQAAELQRAFDRLDGQRHDRLSGWNERVDRLQGVTDAWHARIRDRTSEDRRDGEADCDAAGEATRAAVDPPCASEKRRRIDLN